MNDIFIEPGIKADQIYMNQKWIWAHWLGRKGLCSCKTSICAQNWFWLSEFKVGIYRQRSNRYDAKFKSIWCQI